jgi:hypothetical protein
MPAVGVKVDIPFCTAYVRLRPKADIGQSSFQRPTKFELVINLKAAKARGFIVPDKLLALANQGSSNGDVRFWPKADIPICTAHVRFRDEG